MIVYKIRRKSDGKFSTGGSYPSFTKNGKIWKQKGHLTSHLNQLDAPSKVRYIKECEIIPFELVELPAGPPLSISNYLQEIENKQIKRKEDAKAVKDAYQKEQRREEYRKLMKEFGTDIPPK